MILYYAELPGGERVFVDPVNEKLEIVDYFKYTHSLSKDLGTDESWMSEFENRQDAFLSWAKGKIDLFPGEYGECGCYEFNGSNLHLIKENMVMEGDHQSCTLFNGERVDEPVTGTGVLEEWDKEGRLILRKIGTFKDGMLQGPGEKYDFDEDTDFHFSKGEFTDDLLNGTGRIMAYIWVPAKLNEKRLYYISDWVKSCMDPEMSFAEIITPFTNDELIFSSIRSGTFKNDKLDGNGFYFWGSFSDDVVISVGDFSEGRFVHGLNIFSGMESDYRVIIRKGDFTDKERYSDVMRDGTYEKCVIYALWDFFRFSDLVPLINGESTLRDYMVNNQSFSPELYQQGTFIDGVLNGDGMEYTYHHSNEPFETGVNKAFEFSEYNGNFLYGMKHGKGLFKNKNGLKYFGDFFADRFHGKGKLIQHYSVETESDGKSEVIGCEEVRIGNFVCDMTHGIIHTARIFEDGDANVFDGPYEVDQLEGTHIVKYYENITAEESALLLTVDNLDPVSLSDEKMVDCKEQKFIHGKIVED